MRRNVRACGAVRCAVVGHVEWIESVLVDRVPGPGEIAHADPGWTEPAGGGSVVAVQLAKLAGACDFFTALGRDELGRRSVERLTELGLAVHAEWLGRTRRGFVQVDAHGERTITTVGPKLRPRTRPPMGDYDAVFFVAGEPEALRAARAARFLAATPREHATLRAGGVRLDLLVGSGTDPVPPGAPRRFAAAPLPGPLADTYGAGDSFAAALCFALARGDELDAALALAARAGAAVVTGAGPFAAQLTR